MNKCLGSQTVALLCFEGSRLPRHFSRRDSSVNKIRWFRLRRFSWRIRNYAGRPETRRCVTLLFCGVTLPESKKSRFGRLASGHSRGPAGPLRPDRHARESPRCGGPGGGRRWICGGRPATAKVGLKILLLGHLKACLSFPKIGVLQLDKLDH